MVNKGFSSAMADFSGIAPADFSETFSDTYHEDEDEDDEHDHHHLNEEEEEDLLQQMRESIAITTEHSETLHNDDHWNDLNEEEEEEEEDDAFIEVILSRRSYRVGESVVGTIRLVPPPDPSVPSAAAAAAAGGGDSKPAAKKPSPPQANDGESSVPLLWPRQVFSNAYLFVAGWCRLDPRWHRDSEYAKVYESPAVHYGLQNRRGPLTMSDGENTDTSGLVIDEHCVCFWTTNVVPLLDLKEREIGRWDQVKPKRLRGNWDFPEEAEEEEEEEEAENSRDESSSSENDSTNSEDETVKLLSKQSTKNGDTPPPTTTPTAAAAEVPSTLEHEQLAFTFRADLPLDIPPGMIGNSCRYFYAVCVGTRIKSPNRKTKQWLRHGTPLQVFSLRQDQPPIAPESVPRPFPMGNCTAMAHSVGLPSHVTADDLHAPTGQLIVNRQGNNSMGSCSSRATQKLEENNMPPNIQTMRITDLQGKPCCVLTVMGVATASPGSHIMLNFDFPIPSTNGCEIPKFYGRGKAVKGPRNYYNDILEDRWTPVHLVCAALEGEEVALLDVSGTSKKRAKAYQLATAYEYTDPDHTERVCLDMLVPLDAPITLSTDIVQINVHCTIDISVAANTPKTESEEIQYSNLRLQLPCRIVHPLSEFEGIMAGEDDDDDEEEVHKHLPLDELLLGTNYRTTTSASSGSAAYSMNHNWGVDDPPLIETPALRKTGDPMHFSSFITKDIRRDLKLFSVRMANECDLIERKQFVVD